MAELPSTDSRVLSRDMGSIIGSGQSCCPRAFGISDIRRLESSLRAFLALPDAPLETVGAVWAVRAPVDMFVHVAHLITNTDWARLKETAKKVLSEVDPSLELPPGERMYARLRNKVLTHSSWLRDGITTTLLILAALGAENDI